MYKSGGSPRHCIAFGLSNNKGKRTRPLRFNRVYEFSVHILRKQECMVLQTSWLFLTIMPLVLHVAECHLPP